MIRKATIYTDTIEIESTGETVVDPIEVEAAEQGSPRRRLERELARDKPTAAILPIYLREMGATPLIDETREVELARDLQEAREELAKLALKLPAAGREYT